MKDLTRIIKHAKSAMLIAPHGSSNNNPKKYSEVELYRFDFSNTKLPLEQFSEAIQQDESESGESINRKNHHLAFSYSLPPRYEEMVEDALFAIPKHALDTIQYLLLNANLHWNNPIYKGYDTNIRESLLDVSKAFIDKAFYLAFDYLYDPDTKYWRRKGNHEIDNDTLKDLTLYTFWRGRTGRGLQSYNAHMYGDANKKSKYNNEDDFLIKRNNNKTRFYLYKEIHEYERLQEDYIMTLDRELNKDKYPSADFGESKGKEKKEKPLYLYEVKVEHSVKEIKSQKMVTTAGGADAIKVTAYNKNDALIMVKNFVSNGYINGEISPDDEYTFYDYTVYEINMDGLTPTKEGVIITECGPGCQ